MNHRQKSWRAALGAAFFVLAGSGAVLAGGKGGDLPRWPRGFALVPQDAWAVLSVEKGRVLLKKAGPSMGLFLQRLGRWMGAPGGDLAAAFLEGSFTAALFPPKKGLPSLLLVFPGGRKGPESLLERLGNGPGARRPAGRVGGLEVSSYTLPPPVGLRLFALQRGDTFLAATSKKLLQHALDAEGSPATKSLEADIALARIFRNGGFQGKGAFFLSFKKGLLQGGPAFLSSLGEEKAWVSWISRLTGKGVETRLRLEWPEPRAGWGALAGEKTCPAFLEKLLPGGEDLVVRAGLVLPEAAPGKGGRDFPLLSGLERAFPIPWRRLLPGLSGDFALEIRPGEKAPQTWAALLELTNPSRVDKVLRAPGKGWKETGETAAGGYTISTFQDTAGRRFSWALAGGRLYLASSPEILGQALDGKVRGEKPAAPAGTGRDPARGVFLEAHGKTAALVSLLPPSLRFFLEGCSGTFSLEGSCDPAGVGFRFLGEGLPGLRLLGTLRLPRPPSRKGPAAGKGDASSGTDWASLTPKERFEALTALERAGDVLVYAGEVEALLEDPDPAVAARAAYALGESKAESAIPGLCKALRDSPNPEVRRYAAYALSRMPDPREEGFLLQALRDEDPRTRGYAATALEKLGSTKAAAPLARALLADPKAPKEVRLRILSALAELGGPREIPKVLLGVGPKEDVDLLRAQVYALQKLTPQLQRSEEEDLLAGLLDSPSSYVKGYAIDRLGEVGGVKAAQALERRLPSEGPGFAKRIQAALAVVKTRNGSRLALEKAVETASKKMSQAREKLVKALGDVRTWPAWKKGVLASIPLILAGLLFMLWRWWKSRAALKAHMKLITLVSSSEEEEEDLDGGYSPPLDQEVSWEEEGAGEEAGGPAGSLPGEPEDGEPVEEEVQLQLEDQEEVENMVPLEEEEPYP